MAPAHEEQKGRGEEVTCKRKSSYCCSLVRCTETRQDIDIQKEGTMARKVRSGVGLGRSMRYLDKKDSRQQDMQNGISPYLCVPAEQWRQHK